MNDSPGSRRNPELRTRDSGHWNHPLRILTNMAFWQSPDWLAATDSIYPLTFGGGDPEELPWWREAWRLYRRRPTYDVVLTLGVRTSFAYALLCVLTGAASRQVMTEVFIDAPRPGWAWRCKTALYRSLARRAMGLLTNSTGEIETNARRFTLPRDRFRYVPLCTTIAEPDLCPREAGSIFSAGRTLRDKTTLRELVERVDQPWTVVGDLAGLPGGPLPGRVEVHREIPRDTYLRRLREARLVVLPLLPSERATGQVVLLEAMSFGKPVIATRTTGTADLIENGVNGWLVEPEDTASWIERIEYLLAHPDEAHAAGVRALEHVRAFHSPQRHTELRLRAIRELAQGPEREAQCS